MKKQQIIYKKNEVDERIDTYLVTQLNLSRSAIKKMIDSEEIKLNNEAVYKYGAILKNNDVITIEEKENQTFIIKPIDEPLNILYEDDNLIIVYKNNGLLTHASSFNEEKTLANIVRNHWLKTNNHNFDEFDIRQGICHRLDKYTEGLLIVAKDNQKQKILMDLIKNNEIKRAYNAILVGNLKATKITVDCPIKRSKDKKMKMEVSNNYDAKNAITHFEVIAKSQKYLLVKCILETGRTHQIRIHAKHINAPVLNDPLYGKEQFENNYKQYLVANQINFLNPFNKQIVNVEINLPKEFEIFMKEFFNE